LFGVESPSLGSRRSRRRTGEVVLYDMSNDTPEKSDYAKRRPGLAKHANALLDEHHTPTRTTSCPAARSGDLSPRRNRGRRGRIDNSSGEI
jgi:hypothetical protein